MTMSYSTYFNHCSELTPNDTSTLNTGAIFMRAVQSTVPTQVLKHPLVNQTTHFKYGDTFNP